MLKNKWLIFLLSFMFCSAAFCVSAPNLCNSEMWEPISGNWEFHNGEIIQTKENINDVFLLKYKGKLPQSPFFISFQVKNAQKAKGKKKKFQAFVILRANDDGTGGYGFGIDNTVKNGRNLLWYKYPKERMNLSRDSFADSSGWTNIGVLADGPYYEVFNESVKSNQSSNVMVMRGFACDYVKQNSLFLKLEGVPAQFRNIQIAPLSEVTPPKRFVILSPGSDSRIVDGKLSFQWDFAEKSEDCREDYEYVISLFNSKNKLIETAEIREKKWQPTKPLLPGKYHWSCKAKTVFGDVWGGEFGGRFTISNKATSIPTQIKIEGPKNRYFTESKPGLVFTGLPKGVSNVQIFVNGLPMPCNTKIDGQTLLLEPTKSLNWGLNRLKFVFMDKNGTLGDADSFIVRTKIPDKYTLRPDGVLLRNGKVVLPYGTYRDPSDTLNSVVGTKQAGFTMTHSYYFEGSWGAKIDRMKLAELIKNAKEYAALCHRNGIGLWLGIPRGLIKTQNYHFIEEYVASLMGEPGLVMWYLADEPDWQGIPLPTIRKVYEAIKRIDPYHQVLLVHGHQSNIPRLVGVTDMDGVQAYYWWPLVPGSTLGRIGKMVNEICAGRNFVANTKSTKQKFVPDAAWCVLQGFDSDILSNRKKVGEQPHTPGAEEIVAQVCIAMAAKSKGIIYYWWTKGEYNIIKDTPQVWQGFIDAGQIIHNVYPLFLERGVDLDVPSDYDGIMARVRVLDTGDTVAIMVNTQLSEKSPALSWKWKLPKSANSSWSKLCGNGIWKITDGFMQLSLKPREYLVFFLKQDERKPHSK